MLSIDKSSQLSIDKFVKKKAKYSSKESSEMEKMNVEKSKEIENASSELSLSRN